jgi:hypothetical protein
MPALYTLCRVPDIGLFYSKRWNNTRRFMPGDNEPAGFIMTTILGIVGAFVAVPRECLPALYGDIDMREARLPCGLELRC